MTGILNNRVNWTDSSIFCRLTFIYWKRMVLGLENSYLLAFLAGCKWWFDWPVKFLTLRCKRMAKFLSRTWEKSLDKEILRNIQSLILRARLFPGLQWRGLLEGLIILLVIFMPVLNLWWYLLPLLGLLFFLDNPERFPPVKAKTKPLNSGAGIWLFWSTLMMSAMFSIGFRTGIIKMAQWSIWLCMAWLVYLTFTKEFCKKVLNYILLSSLIWLTIGYGQLFTAPTPTGCLGAEQSRIIDVRIYSVFGNPNIYALYLLSILILTFFPAQICVECQGASGTSRVLRYFSMVVAVLTLGALYFTYSRTAWLIAGWLIFLREWRMYGIRGLLFWLLIFTALFTIPAFRVRMLSLTRVSDSSFGFRVGIWEGVVKALKDFWVWGIGPGNFQMVYPWYRIRDTVAQHAHQIYLQLWLEDGIFSLIAFGRLSKNLFTGFKSSSGTSLKPLKIILMVFLIFGFFETWWINRFCGGYFWFLAGLLLSLKQKEPATP